MCTSLCLNLEIWELDGVALSRHNGRRHRCHSQNLIKSHSEFLGILSDKHDISLTLFTQLCRTYQISEDCEHAAFTSRAALEKRQEGAPFLVMGYSPRPAPYVCPRGASCDRTLKPLMRRSDQVEGISIKGNHPRTFVHA